MLAHFVSPQIQVPPYLARILLQQLHALVPVVLGLDAVPDACEGAWAFMRRAAWCTRNKSAPPQLKIQDAGTSGMWHIALRATETASCVKYPPGTRMPFFFRLSTNAGGSMFWSCASLKYLQQYVQYTQAVQTVPVSVLHVPQLGQAGCERIMNTSRGCRGAPHGQHRSQDLAPTMLAAHLPPMHAACLTC